MLHKNKSQQIVYCQKNFERCVTNFLNVQYPFAVIFLFCQTSQISHLKKHFPDKPNSLQGWCRNINAVYITVTQDN